MAALMQKLEMVFVAASDICWVSTRSKAEKVVNFKGEGKIEVTFIECWFKTKNQ